jgi:hypothetical protein
MQSDYFTKPLQGALFRKLRAIMMNIDPDAAGSWDHRSVLEECNGTSDGQSVKVGAKKSERQNDHLTPK